MDSRFRGNDKYISSSATIRYDHRKKNHINKIRRIPMKKSPLTIIIIILIVIAVLIGGGIAAL